MTMGQTFATETVEQKVARLEVERELAKARVELKRDTEQLRLAAEQDRAQRERAEALRKRFKDLMDAMATVHGMHGELEVDRLLSAALTAYSNELFELEEASAFRT